MSTVNVNRVVDASGGVLAPISSVMRNRIINGAMTLNQRGASNTSNGYALDRWVITAITGSKMTVAQSSDAPAGFSNSMLITSSAATSIGSGDYYDIGQRIEGFNSSDLMFGTANAKTVTFSFWAKSSLTGTFGGSLQNQASNRSYPFTYTINSANTWEYETITITGDTAGTWIGATNGTGMQVLFGLGIGSTYRNTANAWAGGYFFPTGAVNLLATNAATLQITGCQLEVGTQATSFEYRQYQQELALCQRYFEKSYNQTVVPATANIAGNGGGIVLASLAGSTTGNTSFIPLSIPFKVTKRTAPTLVAYDFDGTANAVRVYPSDSKKTGVTAFANLGDTGAFQFMSFDNSSATSLTAYTNAMMFNWTASAEL
jgi:hypothetical protein